MSEMQLVIHSDGASRGNPGDAGIGILITDVKGQVLLEIAEYLGQATNNVAEYTALIRGLEEGLKIGGTEVLVYCDSELMVKQLSGLYRVKNEGLIPLFRQVLQLRQKYRKFNISHIPREKNKRADQLANLGIDSGSSITSK
ncbi:MAG: ribonuclease HI family protein [Syntrophomonadaceae bacterium]|nr:ribonuclease HI family protein [Syntrophomonadaceae bacterium]